jgi:tetratricopeptide (TPR) repeat protein
VKVDPDAALRTGTVPPHMADRIVDLEWRYKGNVFTKNYLMMLDLLAHNNWERPVYYVSTTGTDTYIGLDDYLQLEGFAYRLVPVRQQTDRNRTGGVNTAAMYDNLMNKFVFDISKPGFLISEDVYRMTITMRNSYAMLAEALVMENKFDSAVAVCDRAEELIPHEVIPYNYFNLSMADAYLKAGAEEKGNNILQKMMDIQADQLAYFFRFDKKHQGYVAMDIQQAMAILNAVGQVAMENGQDEMAAEANETLDMYYNLYIGGFNP